MRRFVLIIGLAVAAALTVTGVVASTASAVTQSWYECRYGEGQPGYIEPNCAGSKSKTKGYNWVKVASATGFKLHSTTNFTLALKIIVPVTISCTSLSDGGTIENYATSNGTFSEPLGGEHFPLSGCTVTSPTGCTVKDPISFVRLKGEATEFEGKPAVTFSPVEGTTLTTITLENCGILNGGHNFQGSFTGIANSSTSSLEFTASSSSISSGGTPGSFVGTSKIETSTGEALKVAP